MIYWENTELQIRSMIKEDIPSFTEAFLEMGWTPKPEIHERYLKEQAEGKRYIFVAQYKGQTAGYATLLPLACDGPYKECYPEVVILMSGRNSAVMELEIIFSMQPKTSPLLSAITSVLVSVSIPAMEVLSACM